MGAPEASAAALRAASVDTRRRRAGRRGESGVTARSAGPVAMVPLAPMGRRQGAGPAAASRPYRPPMAAAREDMDTASPKNPRAPAARRGEIPATPGLHPRPSPMPSRRAPAAAAAAVDQASTPGGTGGAGANYGSGGGGGGAAITTAGAGGTGGAGGPSIMMIYAW